jgi:shikimate kinase
MTGYGVSHGAVTVMNAIPCGKGSTIGIDVKTEAKFDIAESTKITLMDREDLSTDLVRTCVRSTYEWIGMEPERYSLVVSSDIPPSMGLKSSSSVCNAVISSVLEHYQIRKDPLDIVRLGTECAKECGVTITGAFDDACGCFCGGLVVTDNSSNELLLRKKIPEYDVVVCLPKRSIVKSRVPVDKYRALKDEYEAMVPLIPDSYLEVLNRNGKCVQDIIESTFKGLLGRGPEIIRNAMDAGALAAGISGTGPAIAVIAEQGEGERIAERLDCNKILTRTR